MIDIVLFVTFTVLITSRFLIHPRALAGSLHHPMESFYFGAFWVSIALILYATEQYGVPSCGPWLVKTLEICFWLYATCAFLVTVFQYHVIFDEERLQVSEAMPSWVLPAYPFLLLGPLAGVLLYDQPYSSALPILIGGLCFQGLGWMIAIVMYTIYFTRLVNSAMPIEPKRFGMYVAVGPPCKISPSVEARTLRTVRICQTDDSSVAYTSITFSVLGQQAAQLLPPDYLGIQGSYPVGKIWQAIGVPVAIFFLLFGFFNFALGTVSIVVGIRRLRFDLTWWAFVFPNAGFTIALIQTATALDSDGLRGVCSAATIVLCLAWFIIAIMHARALIRKEILWPGMDEDEEDVEGHISRTDEESRR